MATTAMWMVRAGEGGYQFEEFRARSLVAIGWRELGDTSGLKSRDQFVQAVETAYPHLKKMQVAVAAGQVYRFRREIKVGDRVATYDPSTRQYLIGRVTGDYVFAPEHSDTPQTRTVHWEGAVARDALSANARNSLGAISTLFLVPPEAADEIVRLLAGAPRAPVSALPAEEEQTQVDLIFRDYQSKAVEFIKDRVGQLEWEELQQLVAGLLRAMGYKTRISPSGSDRGKDIVASPDGFGFESPRIVVEVKHRTGSAMGAPEVRGFLGGRHKDDKGLYVSTGGFTREARYEADRASIPLTLMDLDDLVKALLEHYENMDADAQRLLPLRRIYWPG